MIAGDFNTFLSVKEQARLEKMTINQLDPIFNYRILHSATAKSHSFQVHIEHYQNKSYGP